MFRFEESFILWFLVLIPLGLLLFYLSTIRKRSQLDKAGDYKIFSRLFPNWSIKREWLKNSLILTAFAFLLISWANPQWGNRKQKVKAKSSDVIIALDISQSMLAQDISPNRMERSKFFLNELVKKLRGDRIGLVFFAGSAYLQMPLTNDYASAETFIKSANTTQAGTQGTVIAEAIEMSQSIFGEDNASQKAIIIISDGENHESEAIAAAREAKSNGTFVFTIGVGTQEGARIPIVERGKRVFKTDKSGNPVTSALNVSMLQDIAEAGGGKYYSLDQTMSALSKLDRDIDKLEKQEVEQRSFTDYNSYFQYFLFLAVILLVIEYFLTNISNRTKSWKSIFGI